MAILKLQQPRWKYDTTTQELIVVFVEEAPDGEPDPASWNPPRKAEIRFPIDPANVTVTLL